MKALLEMHHQAIETGQPGILDIDFIDDHTVGFQDLEADLQALNWPTLEKNQA